jgi:hypothetical protein
VNDLRRITLASRLSRSFPRKRESSAGSALSRGRAEYVRARPHDVSREGKVCYFFRVQVSASHIDWPMAQPLMVSDAALSVTVPLKVMKPGISGCFI